MNTSLPLGWVACLVIASFFLGVHLGARGARLMLGRP